MDLTFNHYRVYLNGFEVSADNINITSAVDQPAMASFALHPTESSYKIPYRTIVHITMQSDIYRQESGETQAKSSIKWDSTSLDKFPPEKLGVMPEYLIFEGEIVQKAFLKSRTQNSIQFQALDFRNILDTPLKHFINLRNAMLEVQNVRMENKDLIVKGIGDWNLWLKNEMDAANGDFLLLLKSFISNTANSFFENYVVARKIKNRLVEKSGDAIKNKLNEDAAQELFFREVQASPQDLTMNDIINSIFASGLGYKFLNFTTNLSPPPFFEEDGYPVLRQFLIMPNLIGIIPPRCNVFFPQLIGSISGQEGISYTRAMLRQDVFGQEVQKSTSKRNEATNIYMAPTELGRKINAYLEANRQSTLLEAVQTQMTAEEENVGIFPLVLKVGMVTKDTDLEYLVDYAYKAKKYENNTITLSNCPFNPFPVAGFPALVFTESGTTGIGILTSVNHTLSSRGQYSNFVISKFIPATEIDSPPSLLIDFNLDSIDNVYNEVLAQGSIKTGWSGDSGISTQGQAIDKVINFYNTKVKNMGSPFYAAMSYVKRPLTNICEIQEFLFAGITKVYKVQMGDTLSKISLEQLGSANLWQNIWTNPENSEVYSRAAGDEHKLRAGDTLYIPIDGGISPISDETNSIIKEHINECEQATGSLY